MRSRHTGRNYRLVVQVFSAGENGVNELIDRAEDVLSAIRQYKLVMDVLPVIRQFGTGAIIDEVLGKPEKPLYPQGAN